MNLILLIHFLRKITGEHLNWETLFKRLIDDISSLNSDDIFQELVTCEIDPSSLVLNKENDSDNGADIPDLNVSLKDSKFIYNVYDKRDKFNFFCCSVDSTF